MILIDDLAKIKAMQLHCVSQFMWVKENEVPVSFEHFMIQLVSFRLPTLLVVILDTYILYQ